MSKTLLKKLQLENFKCYKKATITFKELSIIVGENNAGKSCLIEALRLVSKASQGAKKRVYSSAPNSFGLPANVRGFLLDTAKLKIDLNIIIYFYDQAQYAKITAFFYDKSKVEIYLNKDNAFAVIYDTENKIISNKRKAEQLAIDKIGILPQIGPIRDQEKFLSVETITEDKDTYLASLHFRNEILLWQNDFFKEFKENAEKTWQGLIVSKIDSKRYLDGYVDFYIQDNGFTAEIGKMGNGIQMWLQIIWFLTRSKNCEVIILDEPDIYMHSDLQRKILELVKLKFQQVIIATHSLEIISRVDPDCILEINKKDKTMRYANDFIAVQKIIDDIGGISNLSLINLGRQRRCLFVEGKDIAYLNKFNEIIYGKQLEIPNMPFGGFANIPQLYGAATLLYNETGDQIKCFALADKDYRDDRVTEKILETASQRHLSLYIWKRKEIENYLLEPEILYKFIPSKYNISFNDFLQTINGLLNEQKEAVFDSFSTQYRVDCKFLSGGQQWEISTCNQNARAYLKTHWKTLQDKLSLVGGKDFLSIVSNYFQDNYNVSLSPQKIISKFEKDNIPEEITSFLALLN